MNRETLVYRDGKMVPKSEAAPLDVHYVQSDHMESTWHPANGKRYDSKSEFRKATRAAGCIEMGTERIVPRDAPPPLDKRKRAEHIVRSIEQLRADKSR